MQIHKPMDCVILLGIPITREAFSRALKEGTSDFVASCSVWPKYQHDVQMPYLRVRQTFERRGVRVLEDVSLERMRECFQRDRPRVAILFSHWTTQDAVEFEGGRATADEIVSVVPEEFDGIIDLCVCHPRTLALALARRRPHCLVRSQDRAATAAFWFIFYGFLVEILHHKRVSYLEALEEAVMRLDPIRNVPEDAEP